MTAQRKHGILYGIGVGPGDPELVPVKAARLLGQVDTIYTAASTKNRYSLAVGIAERYIPDTTRVEVLSFPMTRDRDEKERAWQKNAEQVIAAIEVGRRTAFLTLGDPLTYSTYGYVLRYIRSRAPHLAVETIPGITSYQAAAACLNVPLVEGEESLLLVSGAHGGDRLRKLSEKPETVVFLKAYRNVRDITAALEESGLYEHRVGISRCGKPDQEIIEDIDTLKEKRPDYWTLILAKRKKPNGPFPG
jgi:precorrin-2/cobalt-factor-2 C20-methyltransferase